MGQSRIKIGPEAVAAAALFFVLLCLMTAQVVLRFGFGIAVSWLEEVIRLVFVWSVYSSFLVAAIDDSHIRVSLHISLLPPRWQNLVLGLADLVWVGFNSAIIYGACVYSLSLMQFPYRMPTTGVNLLWAFAIVPAGFFILSLRVLWNIRLRARGELQTSFTQAEM
ncbi:TRAP transporter small permease [Afifella sp. IM 167]|uniref:TRAP transporter small permease n=1 Tax=Afifella sp. IM 167 TaxID=2033586 RepID=UPI001CC9CA05|nr:TRAP transporter small permease [Afifella sp. IM 167]MBZ8135431.1 C4-dicarboxylate ABC transporter permease [Afifella sp. IM 167]